MLALVLAAASWAGAPALSPGDVVDTRVRVAIDVSGGGDVLGPLVVAMLGADDVGLDCRWTTQVITADAQEVRLARVTLGPCEGPPTMRPWPESAEGQSLLVRGGADGVEALPDDPGGPSEVAEALTKLPLPLVLPPDDLRALAVDPLQVLGRLGGADVASIRVEDVVIADAPGGRATVRFVLAGQAPGPMPVTLHAPLEVLVERATGRVERAGGEVEVSIDAGALGGLTGAASAAPAALRMVLGLDLTATWGVAPLAPSDANRGRR